MLRNVLIVILILIVLGHFGGALPLAYGGPAGGLVLILLVLVVAGVL